MATEGKPAVSLVHQSSPDFRSHELLIWTADIPSPDIPSSSGNNQPPGTFADPRMECNIPNHLTASGRPRSRPNNRPLTIEQSNRFQWAATISSELSLFCMPMYDRLLSCPLHHPARGYTILRVAPAKNKLGHEVPNLTTPLPLAAEFLP